MGLGYAEIEALCDLELIRILKSKKGRKREKVFLEPDFQYIHNELKKKGVTRQLLWEEYILQNPGGYRRSQFCYLYLEWKKRLNPSMIQNHKAGEKMFVDYSGQTIGIADPKTGDTAKAEIFVAVLGASNYTFYDKYFLVPSFSKTCKKNLQCLLTNNFKLVSLTYELMLPLTV